MDGPRRQWGRGGGRALFPETLPKRLNHAILTGKLLSDPREGWGPSGDPVGLVEIEFPVPHPSHPQYLWAYATYDVEIHGEVGERYASELRTGAEVLVAGRLSERMEIVDGRHARRPTIVAVQIHPAPSEEERVAVVPSPPARGAESA